MLTAIGETIFTTIILSLAIASVAWTVTQEEIFREPREYCNNLSKSSHSFFTRKFFYVFTCEYCFSHWVTLGVLVMTGFRLLTDDWRGTVIAFFVLPWLANQWMSLFRRLRVEIKRTNTLAENAKEGIQDSTLVLKVPETGFENSVRTMPKAPHQRRK
jgi:hypothetical protein